uniref:Inhibitor_I29 domain-containing protein n=1 Tax=Steinernema glaseri TaxID=37863 RepID=A0A1I7YV97_9BILA
MTSRLLLLLLSFVLLFGQTFHYTLTQRDRQWADYLRHTTTVYYNRAWYRRKIQESLRAQVQNDRYGPFQLGNFFGDNYTVDTNANFIDRGRIYSTGE